MPVEVVVDPFRPRRAVFLDRDDTITKDASYVGDPDLVELLPAAPEALKLLEANGYSLILISNQAGVSRGYFSMSQLEAVNRRVLEQLDEVGVTVTASYFCPYYEDGTIDEFCRDSDLRKPAPGMILRAAHRFGIYLPTSWMIGDRYSDIAAGLAAGTRTIKLCGTGRRDMPDAPAPDFFADNLLDAAKIVVGARRN